MLEAAAGSANLGMPAPEPKPTVVIHTNDQQMIAALVGAHSLKSRSRSPDRFDIRILRLEETPSLHDRDGQRFLWWDGDRPSVWLRRDLQSFAPLRRMVPSLLNFTGRVLVLDPDVFAVGDVYELISRDMGGNAILCRQKSQWHEGRRLYSSAVMLLDCAQLRHWQWEREIAELFALKRALGPMLSLLDEPPDTIGLFEDGWNHHDTLNEETRLLHNTRLETQPWKTGLPADYHEHAPRSLSARQSLKRLGRRILMKRVPPRLRYRPHPDPHQERLFFGLLRECLELGSITEPMLRAAMRRNHLRKDALEILRL
jgi:hypothetical protein